MHNANKWMHVYCMQWQMYISLVKLSFKMAHKFNRSLVHLCHVAPACERLLKFIFEVAQRFSNFTSRPSTSILLFIFLMNPEVSIYKHAGGPMYHNHNYCFTPGSICFIFILWLKEKMYNSRWLALNET